jgi:hypothetical protein
MSNIIKSKIHISALRQGMTVEVNGSLMTVSKKHIKYCPFMGYSLCGDASKKFITLIQFLVPTNNGNSLR